MSGKALEALGAIASGSEENSTFRRKLASVREFFPLYDGSVAADIGNVYHEVFELLRCISIVQP